MRFMFRVLAASGVLVFYLPVISGVTLAIADATGGLPGTLTGWWKYIGDVIAEGAGFSASYKENMFTIWGIAALQCHRSHTAFDFEGVDASMRNFGNPATCLNATEGNDCAVSCTRSLAACEAVRLWHL
ncbi:hypothetical protein V1292_004396 [Bradyrhizobium sp. AZCC 1719]|uniref:hypothetical protein n=1 Tax=Bradyrhizobium sp. AZCC 1719 TaxID=3117028 RepID=UPI002FF1CA2E